MKNFIWMLLLLTLFATPAYADALIPLFVFFPVAISGMGMTFRSIIGVLGAISLECFLLWLVVFVEYRYLRKILIKMDAHILKKQVFWGNVVTTLIGVILWLPMFWLHEDVEYLMAGPATLCFFGRTYFLGLYFCFMWNLFLVCFYWYILDNRRRALLSRWPLYYILAIFLLWNPLGCLISIFIGCYGLSYKIEYLFIKTDQYSEQEIIWAVKGANKRSYWALFVCFFVLLSCSIIYFNS